MRNLKRALSLALASVMLLGMMVVGTSAASYPDVDGEDNVEAIAVLNAVGAMIGDENGNFNPDTPVTRNQMAAVVARLLLGPDAEDYAGTVPFTDVPEWAVKYVAACYDNGIVTGRDETTFDGDGTVTAQEAATMMLRALGYENITDTGADWAKRAVSQANKIGLFSGVTGNVTATLNRNDIAQLSLNTLKSTCVTTDSERDIVIGDTTIPGKTTYTEVEVTSAGNAWASAIDDAAGETAGKVTVQLGEKLYEGDLKLKGVVGEADDFGRPAARAWTMKGVSGKIGNVIKEPVAVFTAKTSAGDVADALSGYYAAYTQGNDSQTVPINNKDKATAANVTTTNGKAVEAVAGETLAETLAKATANGKVVEYYAGDDNVITNIVTIEYDVGKVTNVRETAKGTVYTVGGVSGTVYNADQDDDDTAVVMGDVAKDDVVTYVKPSGKPLYIYATTSFEGVQTARNTNKQTITVDGTAYDVAIGVKSVKDDLSGFAVSADTAVFYVDQYGYVVMSEAVENTSEYAVVDEIRFVNDGAIGSDKTVEARLVFTDGTSEIVKVTEINKKATKEGNSGDPSMTLDEDGKATAITMQTTVAGNKDSVFTGKVVTYTKSGSNYKLEYVTKASGTVAGTGTSPSATAATVVESGKPAFSYGGTANGTKDTVYIIKTDDAEYSVYTGYQNVTKVSSPNNTVSIPVAYSEKDGKVNVVWIDASVTGAEVGDTTVEVVYVLDYKTGSEFKNSDKETRYEYADAVLNGDDSEPVISQVEFKANGLYEVKLTEDGEVKEIIDKAADKKFADGKITDGSGDPETIIIGGTSYSCKGAEIYVVNDKDFSADGNGESAGKGDVIYFKTKGTKGAKTTKDDITIEIAYIVKADEDATVLDSTDEEAVKEALGDENSNAIVTPDENGEIAIPAGVGAIKGQAELQGDVKSDVKAEGANANVTVTGNAKEKTEAKDGAKVTVQGEAMKEVTASGEGTEVSVGSTASEVTAGAGAKVTVGEAKDGMKVKAPAEGEAGDVVIDSIEDGAEVTVEAGANVTINGSVTTKDGDEGSTIYVGTSANAGLELLDDDEGGDEDEPVTPAANAKVTITGSFGGTMVVADDGEVVIKGDVLLGADIKVTDVNNITVGGKVKEVITVTGAVADFDEWDGPKGMPLYLEEVTDGGDANVQDKTLFIKFTDDATTTFRVEYTDKNGHMIAKNKTTKTGNAFVMCLPEFWTTDDRKELWQAAKDDDTPWDWNGFEEDEVYTVTVFAYNDNTKGAKLAEYTFTVPEGGGTNSDVKSEIEGWKTEGQQ